MLRSALPFLISRSGYKTMDFLTTQAVTDCWGVVITASLFNRLVFALKYSFCAFGAWLLDMGCYEVPQLSILHLPEPSPLQANDRSSILWHVWAYQTTKIISLTLSAYCRVGSAERLFRNAKWLERESAEMHGWFFLNKSDRRTLFLMPLIFSNPLKKSFPVGGFFELSLCASTSKLTFRHVSWSA